MFLKDRFIAFVIRPGGHQGDTIVQRKRPDGRDPLRSQPLSQITDKMRRSCRAGSVSEDKNPSVCNPRIQTELNLADYPTVYFDGDASVYVGGGTGNEQAYRNIINNEGNIVVYDVDSELDVIWLGGIEMQIDASSSQQ